jgi:hypothetical protein
MGYSYYSASASANQNTVTVVVTMNNNGITWDAGGVTFWAEVQGCSRQSISGVAIPYGQSISRTFSFSVGNSTSARTLWFKGGGDAIGSFGATEGSGNVYVPATPPSVTTPPIVTNQKAVLSGSTVTISWTNNGSGTSNPTGNYVDVKIDNDDWKNILNTKATSTTYTVSANHRYQFRINSYNSAGQSAYQTTNTIYTEPPAPSIVNANATILPTVGNVCFTIDNNSTNYPSKKNEWQYSTDKGSSWSTVQANEGTVVNHSSSNSSLNSFIMGLKHNSNARVRARTYNADNSRASTWSSAAAISTYAQPIAYVNIPAGAKIKAIYINKG